MPTSPLPGTTDLWLSVSSTITLCALAYLLGSIPFGLILARLFGYGDIRKIGSGNIGATNVLRTGNKMLAALTLLLDGAKGVLAVWIGQWLGVHEAVPVLTGFFAILGHVYPIWLKFKGGKGVATSLGVLLALSWQLGLALIAIWILMATVFRYSSLAALSAFIAAPLLEAYLGLPLVVLLPTIGLALLIVWLHRENIQRLLKRTETKIGEKS